MFDLEESSSLLSLLGLLHPSEFFVTVDHSVLWQRHIAWSKPKGADLRQYVTQRYATNMVFLSCLLAAEINVFFNSSRELTDMRSLLGVKAHGNLRYWIGVIIILDACVTIVALVTTFTLWGMVSSISDTNTHALLRSSIGQYVTSLPSKFTVSSLYLFLLWIMLFIINLLTGPIQFVLVFLVFGMFFQVVIPLSAFGRLIIHTGAMAKRPVLDEELEKELLPSGLHASLLIRATDRRRKYASATEQYRKQNQRPRKSYQDNNNNSNNNNNHHYNAMTQPTTPAGGHHPPRTINAEPLAANRPRTDSDELTMDDSDNQLHFNNSNNSDDDPLQQYQQQQQQQQHSRSRGHRRIETSDTVGSENFFFPRASVLNATMSRRDIQDVVEKSVHLSSLGGDGMSQSISMSEATSRMENSSTPSEATMMSMWSRGVVPQPDGSWMVSPNVVQDKLSAAVDMKIFDAPLDVEEDNNNNNNNSNKPSPKLLTIDSSPQWVDETTPNKTTHDISPDRRRAQSVDNGKQHARPPLGDGSPVLQIRKGYVPSPNLPQSGRKHYGHSRSPSMDKHIGHSNIIGSNIGHGNPPPSHPLPNRPPPHRPNTRYHHRRKSSLARQLSLGFMALPSQKEEWEEENEVRAVFDAPPSADVETQDQLLDDMEDTTEDNYLISGQIVKSQLIVKSYSADTADSERTVQLPDPEDRVAPPRGRTNGGNEPPASRQRHVRLGNSDDDNDDIPEEQTALLGGHRSGHNSYV